MAQMVKNLPEMLETWVPSPGGEYLLEKGMATHGEFHGLRSLVGCMQSMGCKESDTTERLTHTHPSLPFFGDFSRPCLCKILPLLFLLPQSPFRDPLISAQIWMEV